MENELENGQDGLGYSGGNDDREKWSDWEWGKEENNPDLAVDWK